MENLHIDQDNSDRNKAEMHGWLQEPSILGKIPVLVLHVNYPSQQMWSLPGVPAGNLPWGLFGALRKMKPKQEIHENWQYFTSEKSDSSSPRSQLD